MKEKKKITKTVKSVKNVKKERKEKKPCCKEQGQEIVFEINLDVIQSELVDINVKLHRAKVMRWIGYVIMIGGLGAILLLN